MSFSNVLKINKHGVELLDSHSSGLLERIYFFVLSFQFNTSNDEKNNQTK